MTRFGRSLMAIVVLLLLTGCGPAVAAQAQSGEAAPAAQELPAPAGPPPAAPMDLPAEVDADPATESGGPGDPEVVNPLTGEPVSDPASLTRRPLLVAVANFPPSARDVQSGLSLASQVWETYIGQGMTRYLVLFYGDYQQELDEILESRLGEGGDGFVIGPVRSGRVVFEDIKTMFPRALLITAGASEEVKQQLSNRVSVYSDDPQTTNAAGVAPQDLAALTGVEADPADYAGLVFDPQPPPGGRSAPFVSVLYNRYNQIGWTYEAERGEYLRAQDQADDTPTLVPTLDRLTGEQVGADNVLVLFATHRFVNSERTIVEMELVYVRDRKGLLFRNGQVYPILWSTPGGRLELSDAEGRPVALRPGLSWFEVVSYESTWNEEQLTVRFHNPPGP
jgi:hypothetical protein